MLMTQMSEKRRCPLCDAPPGAPLSYRSDEWQVVQCPECELAYIDRLPPQHEFEEELAWESTSVSHAEQRKQKYPILVALQRMTRFRMHLLKREPKQILARLVRPGPVVDLGCGAGINLIPPPAGFVPVGIEISKSLAAAADNAFRRFGGQCMQMPAEEGLRSFPRGHFSGALLIGYLEHEFRPRQVLTALREAVRDDAVLVVKVPHYGSINRRLMGMRWSGFRFPDHVNYYTPRTLREIGRRSGFSVHYGPFDRLPVSDSLWALFRPI
jgi:SAM-dependent methyltransferase